MDRTILKVPDEDIVEEFGRVVALIQRATTKPFFKPLMSEAKHKGLNWIEALEYVVEGEGSSKCRSYNDVQALDGGAPGSEDVTGR